MINTKTLNTFNKLLQQSIKKGEKNVCEKNFKKTLFLLAKTKKQDLLPIITKTFNNTRPAINLKKQKRKTKIMYINTIHKDFLACKWILNEVYKGSENQFYKNLANELINTSENKSLSIKQYNDFHQEAIDTLKIFIKPKRKKT